MTNIVLIVMDTARASDTYKVMEDVPNSKLAELADEGTRFTRAFANSPWTLPSHTSIFTGTYTSRHGTHAGHKSYAGKFRTIAEHLRSKGYETFGVTNNAWVTDEFGLARGFEQLRKTWQYVPSDTDFGEIKLTTSGVEQVITALKSFSNPNILSNIINTIYGAHFYRRNDYGATRTNKLVREWLQDRSVDAPFFLFLNYLEPHLDYQPKEQFTESFLPENSTYDEARRVPQQPWKYNVGEIELTDHELDLLRALYRGEISYLDQRIGELRDIFEKEGEWDDTILVLVGDHGENIGEFGLMDHQYSLHDTVLHVPLIITGGSFTGGGINDELVQTIDIFPTLLDAAGISLPDYTQGNSLHPESNPDKRDIIIGEYLSPQPNIERLSERTGVSVDKLQKFDQSRRTIRTPYFKLHRASKSEDELFSLVDSNGEKVDVSNNFPKVMECLNETLDNWLDSFEPASTEGETKMKERTKQRLEDLGYLQ
jgi:arylsulfatase A-like enzyme